MTNKPTEELDWSNRKEYDKDGPVPDPIDWEHTPPDLYIIKPKEGSNVIMESSYDREWIIQKWNCDYKGEKGSTQIKRYTEVQDDN